MPLIVLGAPFSVPRLAGAARSQSKPMPNSLLDAGSNAAEHRVEAERLADKALDRLADAVEVANDWLR